MKIYRTIFWLAASCICAAAIYLSTRIFGYEPLLTSTLGISIIGAALLCILLLYIALKITEDHIMQKIISLEAALNVLSD